MQQKIILYQRESCSNNLKVLAATSMSTQPCKCDVQRKQFMMSMATIYSYCHSTDIKDELQLPIEVTLINKNKTVFELKTTPCIYL